MIRAGFAVVEEEFSDDDFGSGDDAAVTGKRKFTEMETKENSNTIRRVDLCPGDDDVLVLDAESEKDEDLLTLGACGVTQHNFKVPLLPVKFEGTVAITSIDEAGPSVANAVSGIGENQCQMKWLRTVARNQSGDLQCTVSNGIDTISESGRSGTTESIMADTIRGLIGLYQKKRHEIIDSKGLLATPLHVVKQLAKEHEEELHTEVLVFPNGHSRLELFSGTLRGIGEGVTKRIAAQMAAVDLLERVQLSAGAVKVPSYGFPSGWITSNQVFGDLIAVCKSKNMSLPNITCKLNVDEDGKVDPAKPPYRAECWIESDESPYVTVGESESEIFARREAAREMYNLLTDTEYKDTPYAIGKTCRRADELTAEGYSLVMSDYKKKWLLKYRVNNSQLAIPEEEAGLENPIDVVELAKDLDNVDSLAYQLMTTQTIKVTVNNNKRFKKNEKVSIDSSAAGRKVSVEKLDDDDEDSYY